MAYTITVSDWLAYKSSRKQQTCADYDSPCAMKEKIDEACRKNTSSTTSGGKRYGGVTKAKHQASHSNFKQLFSYEALVNRAIRNSPRQALTLAEIHASIAAGYPYFKACPYVLKANIRKTLCSSDCFEKLEEWSGQVNINYESSKWTLARKARTADDHKFASINEPRDLAIEAEKSLKRTDSLSEKTYPQRMVTTNHLPACSQPNATHDDLLKHYIHNTPIYPRMPVITPARPSRQEEPEIKIGQVFSLNPQSSTVLPTVNPHYLPVAVIRKATEERLRSKITPYHPCTFWVSHTTQHSPSLSSFVSEDKERYADA